MRQALHCALALREGGGAPGLTTFGAPRSGNAAFARYAAAAIGQARMVRVTHRRDPVPHLPPVAFGCVRALAYMRIVCVRRAT
jgi:Lipase (class 3)